MKELVSRIKDKEKSKEICDSTGVMEGARSTNQNGCFTSSELAHQGLPWAPTTKKGKEHSQEVEEMEAIKAQISHPYNCSNHPAFHLSACGGGFLFPLHYSTLGPISSLPLFLALWVLLSPLTSFLAAQTQQSPSNYCFPKVHILYHLQKLEVLT